MTHRRTGAALCLALLLSLSPVAAHAAPSGSKATPSAQPKTKSVHISGLPWSSGVTPENASGDQAALFGRERGTRVDNVGVFPDRSSWSGLLSTWWTSALPFYFNPQRDDLSVAIPMWPDTNDVNNTGTDDQWTQLGSGISAVDPNAYIRLGWEMNIGVPWALTAANHDAWIADYKREVTDIKAGCPACQIVWNANSGPDQTGTSSRSAFLSVASLVDVYAIDQYDIYPPMVTTTGAYSLSGREAQLKGAGRLNDSYAFALAHHKKFAVPEWGISCNDPGCNWAGHAGGDDPVYVSTYMKFFSSHAANLAYETYYDEAASYSRGALYTNPIGPLSGIAYHTAIALYRR